MTNLPSNDGMTRSELQGIARRKYEVAALEAEDRERRRSQLPKSQVEVGDYVIHPTMGRRRVMAVGHRGHRTTSICIEVFREDNVWGGWCDLPHIPSSSLSIRRDEPGAGARMNDMDNIAFALTAPDQEVGPACMLVPVPPTIRNDDDFREAYVQGYRHALSDVREYLQCALDEPVAITLERALQGTRSGEEG